MPRTSRPAGLSTIALHGAAEPPHASATTGDIPIVTPIYQSVNFAQEFGTAEGLRYPRYGTGINAEVVQRRLALLDRAEAGLVLVSGMGRPRVPCWHSCDPATTCSPAHGFTEERTGCSPRSLP